MKEVVYIRLRNRVNVHGERKLLLGDIAKLIGSSHIVAQLNNLQAYEITKQDRNIVIIDLITVIDQIRSYRNDIEIQAIGPSYTIIEVIPNKKRKNFFLFILVWLLLFIGSALTIMNFHEDVSMRFVHQRLYKFITGAETDKPLILQIPYSFGLGIGMILFFNHFFKKRFNEEPSPLEVEMFNYQQDLDHYVMIHENKESKNEVDDHSNS